MKTSTPLRIAVASALGLGLALTHEPVLAEGQLEEVLVTARKREENLQKVPISIAAFTSAEIEEAGDGTEETGNRNAV